MRGGRKEGFVVALEGQSGVGKTAVSRAVAGRTGAMRIAEAADRLRPRPTLRYRSPAGLRRLETRLLAEEGRRYATARRARTLGRLVVADTGFLGPLTYSAGLARLDPAFDVRPTLAQSARRLEAAGMWGPADLHVVLVAPSREIARRLARAPAAHPEDLRDRHARVGRAELATWRRLGRTTLPGRIAFVSATGPVEAVVGRVVRAVDRAREGTPPPPPAGPVAAAALGLPSVTVKSRSRSARPPP